MSGIYLLAVPEGDDLDDTGLPTAYTVVAETERKAWAVVQKYVRDQDGPVTINEADAWKKGSKRATCTHIGNALDGVVDGVVVAGYGE